MQVIRWILVIVLVLSGLGLFGINALGTMMSDAAGNNDRLDPWMVAWSILLIVAGVFVALIH